MSEVFGKFSGFRGGDVMNDALTLSKYMYETIAIGAGNQLPISSVCNAKCIFCSNNMNPFPIYREGFRSLKDVKKGIALLDANNSVEIRIGDSLPGRISEGEALKQMRHLIGDIQLIA